jgi:WhiB family redox-sensing transcriptional regulator
MEVLDQTWQEFASCRSVPVAIFFPPTDHEGDRAKAVCRNCIVREQCLEFAIASGERFGVWGGLTPMERRSLVAKRRRASARKLVGQPG